MTVAAGSSTRLISTTIPESGSITGFPKRAGIIGETDLTETRPEYGSIGANSRLQERHCFHNQPGHISIGVKDSPRLPIGIDNWLDHNSRIPILRSSGYTLSSGSLTDLARGIDSLLNHPEPFHQVYPP